MTPDSPTDVHPRPQLTRERWFDLSGQWQFRYDDSDIGLDRRWYREWSPSAGVAEQAITVPFPPESQASGIGDTGFHRVLWYRRTFTAPQQPDERLLLHFGAVDYSAEVWVNGQLMARHTGGHTPFSADITDALVDGDDQVLVVRAVDDPHDLEQPRGKQDWQDRSHAIWYDRTSGIWQRVWLEPVPAVRIDQLRWTPDVDAATLRLDVRLNQVAQQPLHLRLRLSSDDGALADSTVLVTRGRATIVTRLSQADMTLERQRMLWSPETPNLFDADIELYGGGSTLLDRVHSYAAMRSIGASNNRILLNNRPYFLRLVLDQGYWPESHLTPPDPDATRREVQLVRDLGFNGVRLHQRAADPSFLYWCDRLGLLVWAEMPAAYEYTSRTVERITHEWLEIQRRDHSHPCIIAWVPINESWGVPTLTGSESQRSFVTALYHLTKAMDSTRLVVGNDGWEQIVTDVITVHDYTAHGEVLQQRYGNRTAASTTIQDVQPGYRSVLLPG
ncbi:MAG: glycoside hydrolase family 2, partial [Actinobacteria bacterium]|nr:glycoside hydrolase family 2 [Actinomycetota bacterium]